MDGLGFAQAGGGGPAADELVRWGPPDDALVSGGVVIADERHLADGDGEQVEPAGLRHGSPVLPTAGRRQSRPGAVPGQNGMKGRRTPVGSAVTWAPGGASCLMCSAIARASSSSFAPTMRNFHRRTTA